MHAGTTSARPSRSIRVHPRARARACSQFVNSCIDESVRLHTMLPGNTVLRKTLSDVRLLDVDIPAQVTSK
jgi:hypothetical protein